MRRFWRRSALFRTRVGGSSSPSTMAASRSSWRQVASRPFTSISSSRRSTVSFSAISSATVRTGPSRRRETPSSPTCRTNAGADRLPHPGSGGTSGPAPRPCRRPGPSWPGPAPPAGPTATPGAARGPRASRRRPGSPVGRPRSLPGTRASGTTPCGVSDPGVRRDVVGEHAHLDHEHHVPQVQPVHQGTDPGNVLLRLPGLTRGRRGGASAVPPRPGASGRAYRWTSGCTPPSAGTAGRPGCRARACGPGTRWCLPPGT